jgi:hypothetical protein
MAMFGEWEYTCDRASTIEAYARASAGGSDTCRCNTCRNFAAVRASVFPPSFLTVLDSLGIDPRKDGEVYHNARIEPGRHDYAGWFHFIGALDRDGKFPLRFRSPTDSSAGYALQTHQRWKA